MYHNVSRKNEIIVTFLRIDNPALTHLHILHRKPPQINTSYNTIITVRYILPHCPIYNPHR